MASTWRSPLLEGPPSIGASGGMGYGPGSLSLAYWNETGTFGWLPVTFTNGIPFGAPLYSVPKSAWRFVDRPIAAMKASELACTGYFTGSEMSVFHGLSGGKMAQLPMVGMPASPAAPAEPPDPDAEPLLPPAPLAAEPPVPVLP